MDVDAASGGTEVPDPPGTARPQPAPAPAPPGFAEPDGAMFPAARPDAPAPVDEELLVPVGGQPAAGADDPRPSGNGSWPAYPAQPSSPRGGDSVPSPSQSRLNEKYIFDTFVIGASNRFSHAAAVAVAEAPARAYNPLFIWGESGLGKTHLLHAVGHYTQRLFPGMRVRYVSTEEFTNDFINSLRDDRKVAFQRRYRDVDVLLVDDIQFLEGKEGTQEEFFHTFNTLHNANKQIVVSSDRPPKRLETLEDRMRTRFEWGLDHRHPAARARDADRDPAQEGGAGPARRARRRPRVHRRADRAQHPRAGGRADPRHGVRLAEPPAGRHPARRDRAARPHPGLRRVGDHRRRRSWR